MIFRVLLLIFFLPGTALPSQISYQMMPGKYKLDVEISDSAENYPVSINFNVDEKGELREGSLDYPTYDCKASFENNHQQGYEITFKEKMVFGYDTCEASRYHILLNSTKLFSPANQQYITTIFIGENEKFYAKILNYHFEPSKFATFRIRNKIPSIENIFTTQNSDLLRTSIKLITRGSIRSEAQQHLLDLVSQENIKFKELDHTQSEADFKSYIANFPGSTHIIEANNRITQIQKQISIAKYRKKATPDGFYQAYLLSRDNADVAALLDQMNDVSTIKQFISANSELYSHELVNHKLVQMYRKQATSESLYESFLLSKDNNDVKSLLTKMDDIATIEFFVSNKEKLSSHPLINDKLANLYRKQNNFESYIHAFNVTKQQIDIVSAYNIIVDSLNKQNVERSSLDIFYNQFVTSVDKMDDFLLFLNKLENIDKNIYYKKLMTSVNFGRDLTITNFFQSNEYRKILSKFKPSFSIRGLDNKVLFIVEYPNINIPFSFPANCEYSHLDSRQGGLNVWEYLFSSATGAIDYYKVESCKPYKSDLSITSAFEQKLVGISNTYSKQWEVSTFSYTEKIYPEKQNPTRSSSASEYIPCNSDDICFAIVRQINDYRYEIECTKGSQRGSRSEICGRGSDGRWASGCGLGDAFAFHYHSAEQAGNYICNY